MLFRKNKKAQRLNALLVEAPYFLKLKRIGESLLSREETSELTKAWAYLFKYVSGELGKPERDRLLEEINRKVDNYFKHPRFIEDNWEDGLSVAIYLYLIEKIGHTNINTFKEKLKEILKKRSYYRIVGAPYPAELGFLLAYLDVDISDFVNANKKVLLYYYLYCMLESLQYSPNITTVFFDKSNLVEATLAYLIYGNNSGVQEEWLLTELGKISFTKETEEYFKSLGMDYDPTYEEVPPDEKLFILLIALKKLGFDKTIYFVGISIEKAKILVEMLEKMK